MVLNTRGRQRQLELLTDGVKGKEESEVPVELLT